MELKDLFNFESKKDREEIYLVLSKKLTNEEFEEWIKIDDNCDQDINKVKIRRPVNL